MKKAFINILITLIIGLFLYYFMLPPINITSPVFWSFVVMLLVIYFFLSCFSTISSSILSNKNIKPRDLKLSKSIYIEIT